MDGLDKKKRHLFESILTIDEHCEFRGNLSSACPQRRFCVCLSAIVACLTDNSRDMTRKLANFDERNSIQLP